MKIVYIFHAFAAKAGVERILSHKMNYLVSHYGYDVTFITYEQGYHPYAFYLDKRINIVDLDVLFYPLYALTPFKRFIKKSRKKQLFKSKLSNILKQIFICASPCVRTHCACLFIPVGRLSERRLFSLRGCDKPLDFPGLNLPAFL